MVKVRVFKSSNYPVSAVLLKRKAAGFLKEKGISSTSEISIAIIGKEKMLDLAKKYLKEKNTLHNVLSFTENEIMPKFVYPPEGPIQLGEVVVCYPKAFQEAIYENKRIDNKVWELVEHGIMHLLGYHHE